MRLASGAALIGFAIKNVDYGFMTMGKKSRRGVYS